MANSSRSTLRTQILGRQFSSTQYATFVNQMLEEAQQDLVQEVNFRAFFDIQAYTTTANDNTETLPSDFLRLDSVVDTTDFSQLTQLTPEEFDNYDSTATGRPTAYTIDSTTLKWYPKPDVAYTFNLRHYRSPATYTDDNAVSEIPNSDKCLRAYALWHCYLRENDLNQAQYHENIYDRERMRLAVQVQSDANDSTQPERVPGLWSQGTSAPSIRIP